MKPNIEQDSEKSIKMGLPVPLEVEYWPLTDPRPAPCVCGNDGTMKQPWGEHRFIIGTYSLPHGKQMRCEACERHGPIRATRVEAIAAWDEMNKQDATSGQLESLIELFLPKEKYNILEHKHSSYPNTITVKAESLEDGMVELHDIRSVFSGYAGSLTKGDFSTAGIRDLKPDLAKKAFLGVLPALWEAIKAKTGKTNGMFTIEDAERGLSMLSDVEIAYWLHPTNA